MAEQTCGTCRFHVRDARAVVGACHGAPPSVFRYFGLRGLVERVLWPMTTVDDWCGAWQARAPGRPLTPPGG